MRKITKFREAFEALQGGTFLYCPSCGGLRTKTTEPHQIPAATHTSKSYLIFCQKCGARGVVIESWNKAGKNHA